jgi:hypothetical protein
MGQPCAQQQVSIARVAPGQSESSSQLLAAYTSVSSLMQNRVNLGRPSADGSALRLLFLLPLLGQLRVPLAIGLPFTANCGGPPSDVLSRSPRCL